jgi:CheY-specific phosphatase CheX
MRAHLDENSVISASNQFWEKMLAMTLVPVRIQGRFCIGERHLLGIVTLAGVWTGRIEVRMAHRLACAATAAMLMQPIETVAEADTLDATKEIANMIAGVIKSSLPIPCTMTVPDSAFEPGDHCQASRTEDTLTVAFQHADGAMMVSIWEQECRQQPAEGLRTEGLRD